MVQQCSLHVATRDGHLWGIEPGRPSAQLGPDLLSRTVETGKFPSGHTEREQVVQYADPVKDTGSMGQQIDTDAEGLDVHDDFNHSHIMACVSQCEGGGQAAYSRGQLPLVL